MSRFQTNQYFNKLMSKIQKNNKNRQFDVNISKTCEYFDKLGAGHSMEEPGGHLGAWRPSPIYIYIYILEFSGRASRGLNSDI